MKKQFLTLSFLGLMGLGTVYGQGFSVELNAGYGMSMASQEIGYNSTSSFNGTNWSGTDEVVKGSYGAGLNFGLNLGYMLNENLGFGLNASMLSGQKIESTYTYTETGYNSESVSTFQGKMTRITPNIILSVGDGNIKPYAKLGIALGVGSKITYNDNYSNSDGDREIYAFELDQGMAFGTYGELGVGIGINDNIALNVSLNGYNMNWAPQHGIITEYTVNGVDVLPQLTTSDKEVEFVDEISYNSSNTPSEGQPDQDLKMYHPFSSLGLNIGIKYSL